MSWHSCKGKSLEERLLFRTTLVCVLMTVLSSIKKRTVLLVCVLLLCCILVFFPSCSSTCTLCLRGSSICSVLTLAKFISSFDLFSLKFIEDCG